MYLREDKWRLGSTTETFSPEEEDYLSACFDSIYPILLRMTGDRETALDLAQDTFLKAWEKMEGFKGRAALSTWLYRIAVNIALNHLRRAKKIVYTEIDPAIIAKDLPEEKLEERFEMASVREAVLDLPPNLRVCVVLHYFEGKSMGEIAGILGVAKGTAAWRLHVARQHLKKELCKRGINP